MRTEFGWKMNELFILVGPDGEFWTRNGTEPAVRAYRKEGTARNARSNLNLGGIQTFDGTRWVFRGGMDKDQIRIVRYIPEDVLLELKLAMQQKLDFGDEVDSPQEIIDWIEEYL